MKTLIYYGIGFIVLFGIIFSVCKMGWNNNEYQYNNGICRECGTHYTLIDVECGKCTKEYIYQCENGHIIESNHIFEDVK